MIEITHDALIAQLLPFAQKAGLGRPETEAQVNQALASLGWQRKPGYSAEEVVQLGTRMAELARATLVPADAQQRAVLEQIVDPALELMHDAVLPLVNKTA